MWMNFDDYPGFQPQTAGAKTYTHSVVQVLVHSHFDLVSSILIQFAIRKVAQMAPDMISSVAILCTLKEIGTQAAFLFQVTWLIKTFWKDGEMTSSDGF